MAESTAATAKENAAAALEAQANDPNRNLKEGASASGTTRESEAAATDETSGAKGKQAKKGPKKVCFSKKLGTAFFSSTWWCLVEFLASGSNRRQIFW